MSRFIESICYSDGHYHLQELHQERIDRTFGHFFKAKKPHTLITLLPQLSFQEKYKVRVVYDQDSADVEFAEYTPRSVQSLLLVEDHTIEYSFKSENRTRINTLFSRKETADDIIICKKGFITDSSYSNLAFWDGQSWITPLHCLLEGVKRTHYIRQGKISAKEIRVSDLSGFQKVSLINAMLNLDECTVDVKNIRPSLNW